MTKEEGLKRFTSEEAKENGRKGGLASGRARRRKKCIREALETLLYMPAASGEDLERALQLGFSQREVDNLLLVVMGLFQKAKNGDVAAFKQIAELMGDKAAEQAKEGFTLRLVDDLQELEKGAAGKGDIRNADENHSTIPDRGGRL